MERRFFSKRHVGAAAFALVLWAVAMYAASPAQAQLNEVQELSRLDKDAGN